MSPEGDLALRMTLAALFPTVIAAALAWLEAAWQRHQASLHAEAELDALRHGPGENPEREEAFSAPDARASQRPEDLGEDAATRSLAPPFRPSARYLARYLDYLLALIGLDAALSALGAENRLADLGWLLLLVLAPAAWIAPEALLTVVFGTTPGKALIGISLRQPGETFARPEDALRRSAQVWLFGVGAAIPFIGVITAIRAHLLLTRKGATSWDVANNFDIAYEPASALRVTAVLLALFVGHYLLA